MTDDGEFMGDKLINGRSQTDDRDAAERRSERPISEPIRSPMPAGEAVDDSEKDERRIHRRHAIANLKLNTPVEGEVLNASHLGMAVQTNESLKVGWSYAFRMRHGADVIRVPGKVEWCRLVRLLRIDENEFLPVFRLGVSLSGNLWSKPQIHFYP